MSVIQDGFHLMNTDKVSGSQKLTLITQEKDSDSIQMVIIYQATQVTISSLQIKLKNYLKDSTSIENW